MKLQKFLWILGILLLFLSGCGSTEPTDGGAVTEPGTEPVSDKVTEIRVGTGTEI